ncbi:MAG: hypothetical protein ACI91B_000887, partial [Planctomycetota bacterium]
MARGLCLCLNGHLRQQGHANGDHLHERRQAAGAEVANFARACCCAEWQSLCTQAVAVFEQQHLFAGEVRHANSLALLEAMIRWHREHEAILTEIHRTSTSRSMR